MREVKVKKYKGSVLLKFAVFCFASFFVFSMINQQMQISEKEAELESVRTELETQNMRNDELEEELGADVDMDKYAEQYARREFHYTMPNEEIYINVGGQETEG